MVRRKLDNGKFINYKGEQYIHDYYPDNHKYILYDKEDYNYENPLNTITQDEIEGMVSVHSWCLVDYVLFEALAVEYDEDENGVTEYCKVKRRSSHLTNKIPMSRVMVVWSAYCENGITTNKVYYCKSRKEADEYVNCSYPYYLEEMPSGNKMINFMGTHEDLKALHNILDIMYGTRMEITVNNDSSKSMEEVHIELSIDYIKFILSIDYWGIITLAPIDKNGNSRMVSIMKYLQKNGLGNEKI